MASERVNFLLPKGSRDLIKGLQARTSAQSMTEVVRRSLQLYEFVTAQMELGREVVVRDPDGKVDPVIIGRWW